MNASTATVRSVSGGGTVRNGKMVVAERIVAKPSAVIAVDKLSLGAGGVIDLGYGADERLAVGTRTLMTFSELDAEGREAAKGWRFENAGDGRNPVKLRVAADSLVLEVIPSGTAIIIR